MCGGFSTVTLIQIYVIVVNQETDAAFKRELNVISCLKPSYYLRRNFNRHNLLLVELYEYQCSVYISYIGIDFYILLPLGYHSENVKNVLS